MGTLCDVSRGAVLEAMYPHEEDAHDIALEQRLAVVLPAVVLEGARMRNMHHSRLQPNSSGNYVSG